MYGVNILHLIEGAKEAQGLTVIIDVSGHFHWNAICMIWQGIFRHGTEDKQIIK